MPAPNEAARTTVRIRHRANGADTFGAGVFITPTAILSARHVLDPLRRYASDVPLREDVLRVDTAGSLAHARVESVRLPADPDIDLALAMLASANAAAPEACVAVHRPGHAAFATGDELAILGFAMADGAVQADRYTVLGGHPNAGCYIANRAVPEGYSGGPVMAGDALAGIVYARHQTQGQSYFYGLEHIHAFLAAAGIAPRLSEVGAHPLRRYPIGPFVSRITVHTMLGALIGAHVALYQGLAAIEQIYLANAARIACGPDTGDSGVIDPARLPHPYVDLAGFWHGAFSLAGLKSPRMLAALLLATDDDALPPAARSERARMLSTLAAWPS